MYIFVLIKFAVYTPPDTLIRHLSAMYMGSLIDCIGADANRVQESNHLRLLSLERGV